MTERNTRGGACWGVSRRLEQVGPIVSRQRQQTKTKVTYQSGAEPRARGKKEAAETLVSASVTDNNTVAEKKHSKLSGNSFGCRVASFLFFFPFQPPQ